MHRKERLAVRCALVALALSATGCGGPSPGATSSVQVDPGPGWTRISTTTPLVPGRCLAAWTGPDGSTLTLVRTLPIPRGTAEGLAAELSSRFENLPGMTREFAGVAKVGSVDAAKVVVVAPGTGGAIAASGLGTPIAPPGVTLIPTRRINLGFVRPDGAEWLIVHHPQPASPALTASIDAIVQGVTVRDASPASY